MARPFAGKEYNCTQCGVLFRRSQSEIARNRTSFCSTKCAGKAHRMENNPSWKGGSYTNENGYRRIRVGRQYVYEHRYVMEKALGQKLTKSEDVHHVNHNKLDNRIENLIVLSKHDHGCRHDHFRGVNNPLAKLNEKKVEEIRALYEMGATTKTLSERYNTEISNVRLIVRKKTWKHV